MSYWCPGCFEELKPDGSCPDCLANAIEPQPDDLPPGTSLDDRYVLGRVLGRGGFGITYLGWQQMPGRRVAIKEYIPQAVAARVNNGSRVVPSSRKLEPEFQHGLRSFGEEASRLADFQGQPHIVSVFELVPANGTGYMVMEYCPGPTASQYMRMYGGRLSFVDAVDIIGPVLDALTVLHARNVFHRDVSPDNILLTEQGVKLIDFGAARTALAERSVDFSAILKMAFAPPEQYSRRGRQGAWTDVYSAAATIYYLIVGAPAPNAMDRVVHDDLQQRRHGERVLWTCRLGECTAKGVANPARVGVGAGEADSGSQPTCRPQRRRMAGTLRIKSNRHPHVWGDTKHRGVKAAVENADDDNAGPIDDEDRSDGTAVAPEMPLPESVAEYRDGIATRTILGG